MCQNASSYSRALLPHATSSSGDDKIMAVYNFGIRHGVMMVVDIVSF